MLVVEVRGTSGSGKTTVVRAVMESMKKWIPCFKTGRKNPLFYEHDPSGIIVLGHYEATCGGCDNVGSARAVYELLNEVIGQHNPPAVLCEGLLLSEDVKWSSQIPGLRAVFLTTPLDECLRRVAGRREKAGNAKPLDPRNTANRVAVIERARVKLSAAGVDCRRASTGQAAGMILKWLGEGTLCR